MQKPCISCGEVTENSRCDRHGREVANAARRTAGWSAESARRASQGLQSAAARGYGTAWRHLSERARRAQPFCSDCATWGSNGNPLTTDHSPEAWERHNAGLPIRLADVDVVCQRCNNARGAARSLTAVSS